MKIIMTTLAISPEMAYLPGKIYDIDTKLASLWAENGYCRVIEEQVKVQKEAKIETEMMETNEKAVLKKPENKVISKKKLNKKR